MVDLKAFRKDNNLTQIKAAAYFGCNQSFISQIESGLRPIPEDFISRVQADISVDGTHMVPEENAEDTVLDNQSEDMQMVPAKFVQMLFEERKLHDTKEIELIAQNREMIELMKTEIAVIKKTIVQEEDPAGCAIVSGSDLVR